MRSQADEVLPVLPLHHLLVGQAQKYLMDQRGGLNSASRLRRKFPADVHVIALLGKLDLALAFAQAGFLGG